MKSLVESILSSNNANLKRYKEKYYDILENPSIIVNAHGVNLKPIRFDKSKIKRLCNDLPAEYKKENINIRLNYFSESKNDLWIDIASLVLFCYKEDKVIELMKDVMKNNPEVTMEVSETSKIQTDIIIRLNYEEDKTSSKLKQFLTKHGKVIFRIVIANDK